MRRGTRRLSLPVLGQAPKRHELPPANGGEREGGQHPETGGADRATATGQAPPVEADPSESPASDKTRGPGGLHYDNSIWDRAGRDQSPCGGSSRLPFPDRTTSARRRAR